MTLSHGIRAHGLAAGYVLASGSFPVRGKQVVTGLEGEGTAGKRAYG